MGGGDDPPPCPSTSLSGAAPTAAASAAAAAARAARQRASKSPPAASCIWMRSRRPRSSNHAPWYRTMRGWPATAARSHASVNAADRAAVVASGLDRFTAYATPSTRQRAAVTAEKSPAPRGRSSAKSAA